PVLNRVLNSVRIKRVQTQRPVEQLRAQRPVCSGSRYESARLQFEYPKNWCLVSDGPDPEDSSVRLIRLTGAPFPPPEHGLSAEYFGLKEETLEVRYREIDAPENKVSMDDWEKKFKTRSWKDLKGGGMPGNFFGLPKNPNAWVRLSEADDRNERQTI